MNIETKTKPSFFTLLLLISFGSVNAVLFTPALPEISHYFSVSSDLAEHTIIWFLIGYALGQLFYGPIANRFGRKPALYIGIILQMISSIICVMSAYLHLYSLLVVGRFLLAIGSGVGLKMSFTLVHEIYEPKVASQKISYLLMAFAITPGLSIALGGVLTEHLGWVSCFYAGIIYGIFLLILVSRLPETLTHLDMNALKLQNLFHDYFIQFKNKKLVSGGLLMGGSSCFNYAFVTFAPFIAIQLSGMSSSEYGFANLLPPMGLLLGSLISAQLVNRFDLKYVIRMGLFIVTMGVGMMFFTMIMHASIIVSLFMPMMIIFFGLCFILGNSSAIAMSTVQDKSHGSAVLNFLNLALATVIVMFSGYLPLKMLLLPSIFVGFIIIMIILYKILTSEYNIW
jgi:MFS family permease